MFCVWKASARTTGWQRRYSQALLLSGWLSWSFGLKQHYRSMAAMAMLLWRSAILDATKMRLENSDRSKEARLIRAMEGSWDSATTRLGENASMLADMHSLHTWLHKCAQQSAVQMAQLLALHPSATLVARQSLQNEQTRLLSQFSSEHLSVQPRLEALQPKVESILARSEPNYDADGIVAEEIESAVKEQRCLGETLVKYVVSDVDAVSKHMSFAQAHLESAIQSDQLAHDEMVRVLQLRHSNEVNRSHYWPVLTSGSACYW